jgi:hypothetical protein
MWKGSYRKIFPEVVEKSAKVSANDFAFMLATVNANQINDIPHCYHELGVSMFKGWTGLYRSVALSPPQMWQFFGTCKAVGAVPYINTVNFAMQEQITREAAERAGGRRSSRPSTSVRRCCWPGRPGWPSWSSGTSAAAGPWRWFARTAGITA